MGINRLINSKEEGFTFIEILVAVVLISVIIIPMLTAYTNLIRNSDNANQHDKAFDIAQNAADHFTYLYREGDYDDIDDKVDNWNNGKWKDNFDFDGVDEYDLEINQTSKDDNFVLLEIEVSWERKNKEHNIQLETLVGEDN